MTTLKESARLQKLYASHRQLILDGNKSSNPDCRREYYELAQVAYRKYQAAGGKRE